jgi:predicted ferric reductase
MKKNQFILWGVLFITTLLWLLADTFIPEPFNYFSFRVVFVQYTGVVAIIIMSIAMILALRMRMIDNLLGGLDKTYRLHKWLGITVLIVSTLHWWWAQGTKWMVGWGWLPRPSHPPRHEITDQLILWVNSQRGIAEQLGEIAFYLLLVLIVIALVKLIPYHLFKKSHKLLAPLYLVLVYHSIILTKPDYWTQPIGMVCALFMLLGTVSAIIQLRGRIGSRRKVKGKITNVVAVKEIGVTEATIKVGKEWEGHTAGQFAFVTSKNSEGAHPYTIASAWDPQSSELTFIIKALGDWTSQLSDWLKVDMSVSIEGPYGKFDFEDDCPRQIWVGAGIGITPFIAKMKEQVQNPCSTKKDLFFCVPVEEKETLEKLKQIARDAGVNLHLFIDSHGERLTGEKLRQIVPDWQQASMWFCGPSQFGKALKQEMTEQGLSPARFHQELFEFR